MGEKGSASSGGLKQEIGKLAELSSYRSIGYCPSNLTSLTTVIELCIDRKICT